MLPEPVLIVRGVVSELQVGQTEEEFVFSARDKAAGAAAAVGLAVEGLAGAATSAALNAGNTAERVDFFVCKVGDFVVKGQFGKVTFSNGDSVEVLGSASGQLLTAHAVARPIDRTIWMHPHCGRGSISYRKYYVRAIAGLAIGAPLLFIVPLMAYSYMQEDNPFPLWFWPLMLGVGAAMISVVLAFVATRFTTFARLSDAIFAGLGLDRPSEIDLHKRLREAKRTFARGEHFNYHPYARWVYKY